ncbi:MAG: hypothetical protein KGI71_04885 [Patescibacteria group bacterium]|nr:hypothetical protein [Patescibacteria group bacterium]
MESNEYGVLLGVARRTEAQVVQVGGKVDKLDERLDKLVEAHGETRERLATLEGARSRGTSAPPMRQPSPSGHEIVIPTPAIGQSVEVTVGKSKSIWSREPLKSAVKFGTPALLAGVVSWFGGRATASQPPPAGAPESAHLSTIPAPPMPPIEPAPEPVATASAAPSASAKTRR